MAIICFTSFSESDCPRRDFAQKAKSRGGTLVTCAYIKESTYSWNIQSYSQYRKNLDPLNRGRGESVFNDCRVPSAADTRCCALEIGNCQPQYRIQQHKLTQQHLISSPTRLNYCTHRWKLKGEITMYKVKKGAKTNYKRSKNWKENEH